LTAETPKPSYKKMEVINKRDYSTQASSKAKLRVLINKRQMK
jgi:hypothetical protein